MEEMKPFVFSVQEEPKSMKEVFKQIRNDYGEEYGYMIDQLERDRSSVFAPVLVKYCPISESEGKINFLFSDADIVAYESDVDKFCFSFREGMRSAEFLSAYDCAGVAMDNYTFWEAVVDEREEQNGQSKIMLSTMTTLLQCGPEVHLLIIGSSSEDTINAGRSYDTLIDYLTLAGYRGSMLLIDPYEREEEFDAGNFRVKCEKRKYDYNAPALVSPTGHRFTHVYDDVWVPTLTADAHGEIPHNKVNVQLVDGTSKFAYRVDNGTLVLKSGLKKHKDLEGALGGGFMSKTGRTITISGTSTGVGPYREDYVAYALREFKVNFLPVKYKRGRLTYDPEANLFKQYPRARISTKYFGEDYERPKNICIMDQTWYKGLEKRLVTNMPKLLPTGHAGCGCAHCAHYDVILSNFKVHSTVSRDTIITGMLSRVIRDRCIARYGASFNNICGRWITAARLYATYEQALISISKACGVNYGVVERAYRYLRNNNKIDIRGCKVYSHPYKKYTLVRDDYNPTRYYIPKKPEAGYIVRVKFGYKVYDRYGNDISATLRDKVLDYRPGAIDSNADDVIEYFVKKYGHLFSYVDGYNVDVSGRRPCGFTLEYYYAIVRQYGQYMPIEIYRGWALVRTK